MCFYAIALCMGLVDTKGNCLVIGEKQMAYHLVKFFDDTGKIVACGLPAGKHRQTDRQANERRWSQQLPWWRLVICTLLNNQRIWGQNLVRLIIGIF